MGAVYLGEHTMLSRPAAIKILLPTLSQNREMVGRFFNEARATTAIRHPGIVEIYDFGFLPGGAAYIVMEMLEGETLASRLRRVGRVPVGAAIDIGRQVAAALHAAHSRGVTHRDLKPDNMFLIRDPEIGERVKLLDFGIAKLVTEEGGNRTRTGVVMGTPVYMSPEQCRGTTAVDSRADLYSLGCVLYELLTGRPPFVVESAGDIIAHHLYFQPEPVRKHDASIPEPFEQLIVALLAKDPAMRPASAADVSAILDGWRGTGAASAGGAMRTPPVMPLSVMPPTLTPVAAVNPIAAAAPTTLSGSAGAVATPTSSARYAGKGVDSNRRWVRPAAIGTVVVAAGAIAIALVARRPDSSATRTATAQTPAGSIGAGSPPPSPAAPLVVAPPSPAAAASASPPSAPPSAPSTSVDGSAPPRPEPAAVGPPVPVAAASASSTGQAVEQRPREPRAAIPSKPVATPRKKDGDTVAVVPAPRDENRAAAPIAVQGTKRPAAPPKAEPATAETKPTETKPGEANLVDATAMRKVDAVTSQPDTKQPEGKIVGKPVAAPPRPRDQRASVFWRNAQRTAETGDCSTALSLAIRVKEIDPAYYSAVNTGDGAVAGCSGAEERRRLQEAADARRRQEIVAEKARHEAKWWQEGLESYSPDLKRLMTQCRTAALRNDCGAARAIAARIADQYPAVYRDHVVNSATIAKCLNTN